MTCFFLINAFIKSHLLSLPGSINCFRADVSLFDLLKWRVWNGQTRGFRTACVNLMPALIQYCQTEVKQKVPCVLVVVIFISESSPD